MFPVILHTFVPPHVCVGNDKIIDYTEKTNRCGNGLEVPCKYIIKGPFHMNLNVEKIIKCYLSRTTK